MMICKRCETRCPIRESGLCLHCEVAVALDEATGGKISDGTIKEGNPDWQKPRKGDKYLGPMKPLL